MIQNNNQDSYQKFSNNFSIDTNLINEKESSQEAHEGTKPQPRGMQEQAQIIEELKTQSTIFKKNNSDLVLNETENVINERSFHIIENEKNLDNIDPQINFDASDDDFSEEFVDLNDEEASNQSEKDSATVQYEIAHEQMVNAQEQEIYAQDIEEKAHSAEEKFQTAEKSQHNTKIKEELGQVKEKITQSAYSDHFCSDFEEYNFSGYSSPKEFLAEFDRESLHLSPADRETAFIKKLESTNIMNKNGVLITGKERDDLIKKMTKHFSSFLIDSNQTENKQNNKEIITISTHAEKIIHSIKKDFSKTNNHFAQNTNIVRKVILLNEIILSNIKSNRMNKEKQEDIKNEKMKISRIIKEDILKESIIENTIKYSENKFEILKKLTSAVEDSGLGSMIHEVIFKLVGNKIVQINAEIEPLPGHHRFRVMSMH